MHPMHRANLIVNSTGNAFQESTVPTYTRKSTNIYTVPNTVPTSCGLSFSGFDRYHYPHTIHFPDLSTLFIGAPGKGKTVVLRQVLNQLDTNPNSTTIVLDIKGEYYKLANKNDVILSMYDLKDTMGTCVKWDMLKECYMDAHPETYLLEFARMVFKDAMENSKEPFFPTSAMLVFYSQLYYLYRYYANSKYPPSTANLISTIRSVTDKQIVASVNLYKKHLGGIKNLINETDATRDIRSVLESTLSSTFVLGSNFCAEGSNFSIRQYMRSNVINKRLFIVYDFNHRESSGSMARMLLDLALKEVIGGEDLQTGDTTRYNFLLDEFAFLPCGLNYLEPSLNFGRSKGVRLYGGLQNYSQLAKLYNGKEHTADSTFAGFSNVVCFKPNDEKSIDAIVRRAGSEECSITTCSALGEVSTRFESTHTISEHDLTTLDTGDTIILLDYTVQGNRPFWFHYNP